MILSEKKLVVACVIGATAGIIALFVLSLILQPLQLPVSKALDLACSKTESNSKARISGFVESITIRDNFALIKVSGSETIDAVSFDTALIGKLGLKRLQEVEITGELRNYNGKPSLIIAKLKPINSSQYALGEEND